MCSGNGPLGLIKTVLATREDMKKEVNKWKNCEQKERDNIT